MEGRKEGRKEPPLKRASICREAKGVKIIKRNLIIDNVIIAVNRKVADPDP